MKKILVLLGVLVATILATAPAIGAGDAPPAIFSRNITAAVAIMEPIAIMESSMPQLSGQLWPGDTLTSRLKIRNMGKRACSLKAYTEIKLLRPGEPRLSQTVTVNGEKLPDPYQTFEIPAGSIYEIVILLKVNEDSPPADQLALTTVMYRVIPDEKG